MALPDPIVQAARHKIQLNQWLNTHKIPAIPIEYLAVMSSSTAIITSDPTYHEVHQYVCKPDNLCIRILELEQRYKRQLINNDEVNALGQLIVQNHTPLKTDIL